MTPYEEIRQFVVAFLVRKLNGRNDAILEKLDDTFDFFENEVIDSMGYVELATALEDQFGVALDFASMEIEEMTIIGPLCRNIAVQLSEPE